VLVPQKSDSAKENPIDRKVHLPKRISP
jgi:hypothetical protein